MKEGTMAWREKQYSKINQICEKMGGRYTPCSCPYPFVMMTKDAWPGYLQSKSDSELIEMVKIGNAIVESYDNEP